MPGRTYRGRVPAGEGAGSTRGSAGPSGSGDRVRALGSELRRLHDRIRGVLDDARDGLDPVTGAASLGDELVLRCRAVCTTLGVHHRDEDAVLFPWLRREHPGLGTVVDRLEQDHAMIGTLLADLERVVREGADASVVVRHLEGVDAIMESHFRYEERELVALLDALEGDGPDLPARFWCGG
jgi:hypothetical protein